MQPDGKARGYRFRMAALDVLHGAKPRRVYFLEYRDCGEVEKGRNGGPVDGRDVDVLRVVSASV